MGIIAKSLCRASSIGVLLIAAPASAQTQNSQAPARTIPGLDNFSLPPSGQQAAPLQPPIATPRAGPAPSAAPTPRLTPTPRATVSPPRPSPVPIIRAPAPTARPTPRATPAAIPAAIPAATSIAQPRPIPPTSVIAPVPVPVPFPIPTPTVVPIAAPAPVVTGIMQWLVPIGLALLALAVLAFVLLRRRRIDDRDPFADPEESPVERPEPAPPPRPVPTPAVTPPAPMPPQTVPRAEIAFELRPKRAGANLTSAAVDYVVVVRNEGASAARAVAVDIRLLSASARQDDELRAIIAAPIDRPVVAPFDLAPGASVELTGMAMLPRDALTVMTVEGRALFVPVLTLTAAYGEDAGSSRAAAAWVIGIDRGPGAKMAPFRLDGPPRMHAAVLALPYPVPAAG